MQLEKTTRELTEHKQKSNITITMNMYMSKMIHMIATVMTSTKGVTNLTCVCCNLARGGAFWESESTLGQVARHDPAQDPSRSQDANTLVIIVCPSHRDFYMNNLSKTKVYGSMYLNKVLAMVDLMIEDDDVPDVLETIAP